MKNAAITAVLLSLILIATAAHANVNDAKAMQKMERGLAAKLTEPGDENERVIVWVEAGKANSKIASSFGDVKQEFSIIPAIAMDVKKSKLKSLASLGFVKKISIDHKVEAFRNNAVPITASDVAMNTYGYNGTNIKIAVIDTGVYNHTEFQTPNRIFIQKCFAAGACPPDNANTGNSATDDNGHGTHVAGIAAGEGSASNGRGSAPNATIIAIKVLNSAGGGWDSDVVSGMQFAVDNGANIISMSLGADYTQFTDCYDVPSSAAVDNATSRGVAVVIAAGNEGSGSGTIAAPGCAKTAITVGAANKNDNIASYSSRGPTNDNRTKPDIVVTGTSITSTSYTGGYTAKTGTSMATPLVAGIAATLMEKYNATRGYMPKPGLVKAILLNSVNTSGMSADGYTQRNNAYGSGRADAYDALYNSENADNYSIIQNAQNAHRVQVSSSELKVTLVWMENSTTRNNLDLIIGNGTNNFTNPTDANDTVEQVFLSGINNGPWTIHVNGTSVTGSQEYFIAHSANGLIPSLFANASAKASGATYAPKENYSFQIKANTTLSYDHLSHVIFQMSGVNYTKNSAFPVYNNSAGLFWINLTDLPAGAHSYQWFSNSSQNNWNSTSPLTFTIAKNYSRDFIHLTINGTGADFSSPYRNQPDIIAWKNFTEGNLTLYRNGSVIGTAGINEPNETALLSGGVYNYTVVFEETQNYSLVNITRTLTITKAPTNITLLLNGSAENYTYNLSTAANFTAYVNTSGRVVTLISNMSGWVNTNNENIIENLTVLNQIGIFNMTAYFAGDQNYSFSSQTLFATIVDSGLPSMQDNYTQPDSGIEYHPGRVYIFNISVNDNNAVSNVTLQLGSQNYTAFIYQGSAMSGNWSANVTDLAADDHPIVWYTGDASGNWNKTGVWYYDIEKNSSSYTMIMADAMIVEIPGRWSVNSTSPVSAKIETRIYSNESGNMVLLNGSTGTNLYSGSAFPPNIVNISANLSSNENYTVNSTLESVTIRFVDTAKPSLKEGMVLPRTVETRNNLTILIVADDYGTVSAVATVYNSTNSSVARFGLYYVTNTTANVSYLNRTTWVYSLNATSIQAGSFYANVSLTDASGNAANYSLGNFTITSGSSGTIYSNSSVTLGSKIEINLLSTMNVSLNISSTSESGNDAIMLATYSENPSNRNSNAVAINKFAEISAGGLLNHTLSWVIIRMNYNASDIPSGYGESNLRIYYNQPNGTWVAFDGAISGGVNTTEKYVWANSTHFSLYGIFLLPTCSDSLQNQGETGTDCGGPCGACASAPAVTTPGGGGSSGSVQTTTTTITTTTTTTAVVATTTTTTTATTTTTTTEQDKIVDIVENEPSKKYDNRYIIAALLFAAATITAASVYKNRKKLGYILYSIKKNSSLE